MRSLSRVRFDRRMPRRLGRGTKRSRRDTVDATRRDPLIESKFATWITRPHSPLGDTMAKLIATIHVSGGAGMAQGRASGGRGTGRGGLMWLRHTTRQRLRLTCESLEIRALLS